MGKLSVLPALLLAACGSGAPTMSTPSDPPAEASAPEAAVVVAMEDRDATPANVVSDAAAPMDAGSHVGPWLPLVAIDASATAVADCQSSFTGLAANCGAKSALSREAMNYVDLCDFAHGSASQYCEGVSDPSPAPSCVSKCWRGTPYTQLSDALCVFRCFDAAICGTESSQALSRCDDSDAGADPIGCLITDSCYPSFASTPW